MDQQERVKLSKKLSYLLRHGAEELGLTIQSDGYIQINHILRCPGYRGSSFHKISEVVEKCSKKRFEMKQDPPETGPWFIRASQGHTMKIIQDTELLTSILLSDSINYCIHGTYVEFLNLIQSNGLSKMQRNHIHFAEGLPGDHGVISGMRGNCTAVVIVDMKKAIEDGILFYRSTNNVILSPGMGETGIIPPKYFVEILIRKNPQCPFQSLTTSTTAPNSGTLTSVVAVPLVAVPPSPSVAVAPPPPPETSKSRVQHLSVPPNSSFARTDDKQQVPSVTSAPMSWAKHLQLTAPASSSLASAPPLKSNPPSSFVTPPPSSREISSSTSVDYYCIIDFEATCLEEVRINPQEIIEFPAIMINAHTMKTVEEELGPGHGVFHSYVKPIHHPKLSSFCTDLTGIEQSTVDHSPIFSLVYQQFLHFLQPYTRSSSVTSSSSSSSSSSQPLPPLPPHAYSPLTYSNIVFVSHGDFDFKTALSSQCQLSSQQSIVNSWINIKTIFTNLEIKNQLFLSNIVTETTQLGSTNTMTNRREKKKTHQQQQKRGRRQGLGMAAMLDTLNLPLIGRHHSGIDDSRNIARIFLELVRRGGDLSLYSTMPREYHRPSHAPGSKR
jgi:2'-phosphotransferase